MQKEPEVVLQAHGLTKLYGSTVGVRDLDLAVQEGEIFGFLGPNGSGKTTTIRLLTGFLRPTGGTASILGMDTWRDSHRLKRELGFLPDEPSLYEDMRGTDLLDYLAGLQKKDPSLRARLCDQLELGREDLARPIRELSRGMKQKLALIQALQHDPTFLVLDEPTEGLDPLMQQAFFHVLQDLQQRGRTVFMSSHILPDVERLCNRVGIIRHGELIAVEEVEVLRRRSIRYMEVELKDGADAISASVPEVTSVERRGNRLKIGVRGNVTPLLQELARLGVEDMVYEQAHLEDIFLDYYRGTDAAGPEEDTPGA